MVSIQKLCCKMGGALLYLPAAGRLLNKLLRLHVDVGRCVLPHAFATRWSPTQVRVKLLDRASSSSFLLLCEREHTAIPCQGLGTGQTRSNTTLSFN